jgi:hypothetical protein
MIQPSDYSILFSEVAHSWGDKHGQKAGSQEIFGRDLIAAFPTIHPGHSGAATYYKGIEMNGVCNDTKLGQFGTHEG